MKIARLIACFIVITVLLGCASTDYSAFEGSRVIEGSGGAKKTVDGMDIWRDGSPPREFKIIGIIDDTRRQSLIGLAGYEAGLVKKAREAGGDALLILDAHTEVVGYRHSGESGTAQTTGTVTGGYYQGQTSYQGRGSTTSAVRDKITKAAVIKYQD